MNHEWFQCHRSDIQAMVNDWQCCDRGDMMFWALGRLRSVESHFDAIKSIAETITRRALTTSSSLLKDNKEPWVKEWIAWKNKWISGEDRSLEEAARASHFLHDNFSTYVSADAAAFTASHFAALEKSSSSRKILRHACGLSATAIHVAVNAAYATVTCKDIIDHYVEEARVNELKLQAYDIRKVIPEWTDSEETKSK